VNDQSSQIQMLVNQVQEMQLGSQTKMSPFDRKEIEHIINCLRDDLEQTKQGRKE